MIKINKRYLIFFLFILLNKSFSQINIKEFDYYKCDSIALNFVYNDSKINMCELANSISRSYNTDHEKFRVIFRWIANNIKYSECANSSASSVLKSKKASCLGYARLLKEMSNCIGIECGVVDGWVKTKINDIGVRIKQPDHSWNIARINGKEYLFDVSFSASGLNPNTKKKEYIFDDFYYATPPEYFIITHFPLKFEDQLLNKIVKYKYFINLPIVNIHFFKLGVVSFLPICGVIKSNYNQPCKFKFAFKEKIDINQISAYIDEDKKMEIINKNYQNNIFTFQICFLTKGEHILTFYGKGYSFISYKIIIK